MAWFSARGQALPPAVSLAAPLAAGKARILAARPGGTVRGRSGKTKILLRDGDEVTLVDDTPEPIGHDDEVGATVLVNEKKVVVANAAIITEKRLRRCPAAALRDAWAIFSVTERCDDICIGGSWLLGPGVRVPLGGATNALAVHEGEPTTAIAWRPDGRQVVVEGTESAIASLPDGRVRPLGSYEAPVYSQDGRLFVRGEMLEGRDNVFEVQSNGKLRWITGWPGNSVDEGDPDDPGDPDHPGAPPVAFLADGTLVVTFQRPGKLHEVRIPAAQIGTRPEDLRAEEVFRTAHRLERLEGSDAEAAGSARALVGKTPPLWTRELASSANTRGYVRYKDGEPDAALPLFEVAADLDPSYGMPRYNAARVYALRGDAAGAVRWLGQLKAMGTSQRARLAETRKDEAFKKIWDAPGYAALGVAGRAPARAGTGGR
jgi:hypothetical protein